MTGGRLASPKRIARVFRIGLTCASARNVLKRRREFVMRKMILAVVSAALLSRGAYGQDAASGTHSCEDLAQLELLGARILSAETVAAGAFTPPNVSPRGGGDSSFYKMVPAFCRVVAEAAPSADSSIKIEVWMPANGDNGGGWNGKLQGRGNGGFSGEISYPQLGIGVSQGYAMTGTDGSHSGDATYASWALGHPEKVADFGYRAIHEMTRVAKAAVKAYYGKDMQHSYFWGCSNGGRQALMEAQRFPEDYDGILAGAPANYWTHLLASALWDAHATALDPASYIPTSKIPAIAHAVNEACDAADGVKDGVLNDPRKCHFTPATLLCKEGDSDSCLTQPQVTALEKLYQGARDSKGRQVFPGFMPGGEEGGGGWPLWITGHGLGPVLLFAFGNGYFSDMVYNDANWNYKTT